MSQVEDAQDVPKEVCHNIEYLPPPPPPLSPPKLKIMH